MSLQPTSDARMKSLLSTLLSYVILTLGVLTFVGGGIALQITGPLVAFLNARDNYHAWAVAQFSALTEAMRTSEAVLAEAAFLLKSRGGSVDTLFSLMGAGALVVALQISDETTRLRQLMARYAPLPMSLADATLVRLTELLPGARVLTLDRDFLVYRQHGRQVIPLIAPFS